MVLATNGQSKQLPGRISNLIVTADPQTLFAGNSISMLYSTKSIQMKQKKMTTATWCAFEEVYMMFIQRSNNP